MWTARFRKFPCDVAQRLREPLAGEYPASIAFARQEAPEFAQGRTFNYEPSLPTGEVKEYGHGPQFGWSLALHRAVRGYSCQLPCAPVARQINSVQSRFQRAEDPFYHLELKRLAQTQDGGRPVEARAAVQGCGYYLRCGEESLALFGQDLRRRTAHLSNFGGVSKLVSGMVL